jgi:hypothetical protein
MVCLLSASSIQVPDLLFESPLISVPREKWFDFLVFNALFWSVPLLMVTNLGVNFYVNFIISFNVIGRKQ